MNGQPTPEVIVERVTELSRDADRLGARIESVAMRLDQAQDQRAVDRATMERAYGHSHANTETLHGKDGVLVRLALAERQLTFLSRVLAVIAAACTTLILQDLWKLITSGPA